MNNTHKNLLFYITKCIAALGMIYFFSYLFHYPYIGWCLISAVLVLSPDANEALPLALARIEANLVGGASTLLCLVGGLPNIATISLAYCLTITACYRLNLMNASRTALAAVTIITLTPADAHLWGNSLERVLSVVAGCIVGLVITLVFHRRLSEGKSDVSSDHAE